MQKVALLVACLACAGHGRRVKVPDSLLSIPRTDADQASLATLLLSLHPAAAFSGSGPEAALVRAQLCNRCCSRQQILMAEEKTEVAKDEDEGRVDFTFDFTDEAAEKAKVEEAENREKNKEVQRLRDAEKFVKKATGNAQCKNCRYIYDFQKGCKGAPPKTAFALLPDDFTCPKCKAPKDFFEAEMMTIAGFQETQSFGFGTNTMDGESKANLVWGGLAAGVLLLFAGYGFN